MGELLGRVNLQPLCPVVEKKGTKTHWGLGFGVSGLGCGFKGAVARAPCVETRTLHPRPTAPSPDAKKGVGLGLGVWHCPQSVVAKGFMERLFSGEQDKGKLVSGFRV